MTSKKTCQNDLATPQNDLEPEGNLVCMTNALTRAGHGLTLAEKRLIMLAMSKLDSRATPNPSAPPVTIITAAEYAETFGVDADTAYDQLQSGAKNLYNRSITFYEPAYRRNGKPLPPTKVQMRWVGSVKYQEGEGWVRLAWWHEVIHHLMGFKKQFTTYQLQQASALRSSYSWKLLELLMRFKSTGYAEYTIEDFTTSMEATEKQCADFGKIRTKIIEPAIKELTEKSGWLIQWQPIKAGRKVKAVRFNFMQNPERNI
jgi:plasmid replication initiation protein